MNGLIYEDSDSWWTSHGALIGGLIAFGVMFVLFAWGMSM